MSVYKRVYVVCPGDVATGGPECLHQLVHELRGFGVDAVISYYPFDQAFSVPEPYRRYRIEQAAPEDEPGSAIVLPEVYPHLASSFPRLTPILFWLSAYFFFLGDGPTLPQLLAYRLGRLDLPDRVSYRELRRFRHIVQSFYAWRTVALLGLRPEMIGDCLAEEFTRPVPAAGKREDILAFNPAKPTPAMAQIKAANSDLNWLPITGLSRDEVKDLLCRAKVYVDFGFHPGRERLPREAAMCGACIITGRQGSAGYARDVQIPRRYRLSERRPGIEARFRERVERVIRNFPAEQRAFDRYRSIIAGEPERYRQRVKRLFL